MLMSVLTVSASFAADGPPAWAYGFPQPGAPSTPAGGAGRGGQAAVDNSPKHLAGSSLEFTTAQIRDGFGPADWFPGDHPAMPEIVAHGRRPDIRACALCHYPNGKGRAENAPIAGYPVAYFIQQMTDFKNGKRKSSDSAEGKYERHDHVCQGDDGRRDQGKRRVLRLDAMDTVDQSGGNQYRPQDSHLGRPFPRAAGDKKEPIGDRIIEVPENTEATETYRNPRSGFIAYVPTGSVKKGEALVTSGAERLSPAPVVTGRI